MWSAKTTRSPSLPTSPYGVSTQKSSSSRSRQRHSLPNGPYPIWYSRIFGLQKLGELCRVFLVAHEHIVVRRDHESRAQLAGKFHCLLVSEIAYDAAPIAFGIVPVNRQKEHVELRPLLQGREQAFVHNGIAGMVEP